MMETKLEIIPERGGGLEWKTRQQTSKIFPSPSSHPPPHAVVPVPVPHCTAGTGRLWGLFQAIAFESFRFGYYMIAVSVVKGLF